VAKMGLQDVIRWFLPREDHFYDFLEQQAKAAHEGAKALAKFASNGSTAEEARAAVQKIEHEGDRIVHEMEEALAKTFVTPIDREDLQKLSSELDTVLDLTNGAMRACVMLGVEKPTEAMKQLIEIIVKCTRKMDEAMPKLRKHEYKEIVDVARELRKIEKEADVVYREAVSALFRLDRTSGPFREGAGDARILIREKTVLEDLENAIDQCDAIADTLANLAVKHG
jgi:predicted phosphate transport protein (TIGR00153 family)